METFDLWRSLQFLPGIIIGLTVHEFCHAYVARQCGDTTSEEQGRITLNPLKHIDIVGFVFLIVAGFGWAKPVQFNESRLKNPRVDVMKIAAAGPLSNAATAIILSVILVASEEIMAIYQFQNNAVQVVMQTVFSAIYINWGLFVFNLIPLPPLDGSHLAFNSLRKFPALYGALYKYGSFLFIGLILVSFITKTNIFPIWPVIRFLAEGFLSLAGMII
ncbi:MAG: site-2 protease family protein [Bacteroidales bacterium]|nr:site-2 protease family protein [Bacteroidales bacterium]